MSHPILPLSGLQSAVFLLNSPSHHLSAAVSGLKSKSSHRLQRTFSRSYGTILPSSFTRVLPSALVFSTRPPVSVWGTDQQYLKLSGFSWKPGTCCFVAVATSSRFSVYRIRILTRLHPTAFHLHNHQQANTPFSVTTSQYCQVREY